MDTYNISYNISYIIDLRHVYIIRGLSTWILGLSDLDFFYPPRFYGSASGQDSLLLPQTRIELFSILLKESYVENWKLNKKKIGRNRIFAWNLLFELVVFSAPNPVEFKYLHSSLFSLDTILGLCWHKQSKQTKKSNFIDKNQW